MNGDTYDVTIWYSTFGMTDSHDYATREYLLSLLSVGYDGIRLPPAARGVLFDTERDPELERFLPLTRPPEQHRMSKLKRIQHGDPRIGTWKTIESIDKDTGISTKTKVLVTEGSVDLDEVQEYVKNPEVRVKTTVIHHDPSSIARTYTGLIRGGRPLGISYCGITVWETNMIPDGVARVLSELDCLIVPSQYSADAFIYSEVETPIHIIPHAFDQRKWPKPMAAELKRGKRDKFIFYTIGTHIERKNLKGLLKAYITAFEGAKDVQLRIKTFGEKIKFSDLYAEVIDEMKINTADIPDVKFFLENWTTEKMRAFHLDGDCFISATRGEGFGLCEFEAKLCGRRVITTDGGATKEFLVPNMFKSSSDDILVPAKMIFVENMYGIGCYDVDQEWYDPKFDALVEAFRRAKREGPKVDKNSYEFLQSRYNHKVIGEQLANTLDKYKV